MEDTLACNQIKNNKIYNIQSSGGEGSKKMNKFIRKSLCKKGETREVGEEEQ